MLSVHTILTVRGGEFVSLMDPPVPSMRRPPRSAAMWAPGRSWRAWRASATRCSRRPSSCTTIRSWRRRVPGNLFDATEIDEILTLRILTLSDEEKAEIRAGGERAREVLERSESLGPEQLRKLHGAVRGLRQVER